MNHIAYIGVGSNLGDPVENCLRAMEALEGSADIRVTARSSLYKTEPVGFTDQEWFVNAAVQMRTALDPQDLLETLQKIEKQMGRVAGKKWGPRIMDLDILFFDDLILESPTLHLPHPHAGERRFVLVPLNEIARELIHPGLNKTMFELLVKLPEGQVVQRIPLAG
jgi:2-amino-4-hydroxy-6-hydroxymethyldihydropteridine diphosphokinase